MLLAVDGTGLVPDHAGLVGDHAFEVADAPGLPGDHAFELALVYAAHVTLSHTARFETRAAPLQASSCPRPPPSQTQARRRPLWVPAPPTSSSSRPATPTTTSPPSAPSQPAADPSTAPEGRFVGDGGVMGGLFTRSCPGLRPRSARKVVS